MISNTNTNTRFCSTHDPIRTRASLAAQLPVRGRRPRARLLSLRRAGALAALMLVGVSGVPFTHAQAPPPPSECLGPNTECDTAAAELVELADHLHHDPVDLLNWVCDRIEYEEYAGSRKGALATFYTRRGNMWDQCSLLITLLRISGVPARYALSGSTPYVEAYVPEKAINGVSAGGPELWVPLVPWLDIPSDYEGLNLFPGGTIPSGLEFNFKTYRASFNEKDPIELFEENIQTYLKNHAQDYLGKSLANVGVRRNVIPWDFKLLPAVLPRHCCTGSGDRYAQVPGDNRAWVTITLKTTGGEKRYSRKLYLAEFATRSLVLDAPVSDSSCTPVLMLDGESIAWDTTPSTTTPPTALFGASESFVPEFSYSNGIVRARPPLSPGVLVALRFDILSASAAWGAKLKREIAAAAYPTGADATRKQKVQFLAKAATFLANGYFLRWQAAIRRADELLYCLRDYGDPAAFLQIYTDPDNIQADASNLTPLDLIAPWRCDTGLLNGGRIRAPNAPNAPRAPDYALDAPITQFDTDLFMYVSSKNEAALFEDMQGSPALSTVAGFMAAHNPDHPVPIATLTRDPDDPTHVMFAVPDSSPLSCSLEELKEKLCPFALKSDKRAFRSAVIEDDQTSAVEKIAQLRPGTVSFDRRVSSEQDHDYLTFSISAWEYSDQDKTYEWTPKHSEDWSGVVDWNTYSYTISQAGWYKLRWEYHKDATGSANDDAAWIDNITVPLLTCYDFENGQLPAGWETGFSLWTVVDSNDESLEGDHSLRSSTDLPDDRTAYVRYTGTFTDGNIEFYWRVSSQWDDRFEFWLDGNKRLERYGNLAWQEASYPVSAGEHILEWRYVKDASGKAYADCAWIDYVRLPLAVDQTTSWEDGEGLTGWTLSPSGNDGDWAIVSRKPLDAPDELEESTVKYIYDMVCPDQQPNGSLRETTVLMPTRQVKIERTWQGQTFSLMANVQLVNTVERNSVGGPVTAIESAYLYDQAGSGSADEPAQGGGSPAQGGGSMDWVDYEAVDNSLYLSDNGIASDSKTGAIVTVDDEVAYTDPHWADRVVQAIGDPIDTVTGEFYTEELPDIAIAAPGGSSLGVTRAYRSRIDYHGPFGEGWTWNHGEMLVKTTDGKILYYDARQTPHEIDTTHTPWTYPPGADFRIEAIGNSKYRVTTKDLTQMVFKSDGRLETKTDRNGNTLTVAYGANDRPATITDCLGRVMTFIYDTAQTSRVSCVTDPLSRSCWYVYGGPHTNVDRVKDQLPPAACAALVNALQTAAPDTNTPAEAAAALGADGDLVAFVDLGGNVTVYAYLQNQTDNPCNDHNLCCYYLPNGDYLEVGYFKNDTVSYHRNAKGNVFHFQYSFLNRYTETWNESGYFRKIFWDTRGNVTRIATEDKTVETMVYDEADHNLLSRTDGNGNTTEFEYDDRNNPVQVTAPDGGVRKYEYQYAPGEDATDFFRIVDLKTSDARANVGVSTPAYVTETLFTDQGNVESITYPLAADDTPGLQRRTSFTYDQYGNKLTVQEKQGTGESFTNIPYTLTQNSYDSSWPCLPMSETDPYGNVTEYTYDGDGDLRIGRVATVTRPDGSRTAFEYNALGQITVKRLARDATYTNWVETTFEYDCNRRLVSTTASNGAVTTNLYDITRDIVSGAQVAVVVDPLGYEAFREYDAVGNLVRQTDRNGNVTTFEYDGLKRLLARTDAMGNRVTFRYDGNGNLVSRTDARGNTTTFGYDAMNRRIKVAPPFVTPAYGAGHKPEPTTFQYDLNGNLVYETDATGTQTHYKYDRLNRLVQKTVNSGGDKTRVWKFAYDVLGRKIRETGPAGHYTKTDYDNAQYDSRTPPRNVVTSRYEKLPDGTDQFLARTVSLYDKLGRIEQTVAPRGNAHYTVYDLLGRKTCEYNDVQRTEYEYDDANNLTVLRVRDAASLDVLLSETRYAYSLRGERTRTARVLRVPDGPAVELATGAVYDPNGNLIAAVDEHGNTTVTGYDALNRRITVTDPLGNTSVFDYDANSNLTTVFDPAGGQTEYWYDELNRQILVLDPSNKAVTADYDDRGLVVTRTHVSDLATGAGVQTQTVYNDFGEPSTVTEAAGTADAAATTYAYNPEGRTAAVTDPDNHTLTFAYDGNGRVSVETDADGIGTRQRVRDAAGNPVYEIRRDGTIIGREFDSLNRLTSVWTLPADASTDPTVLPSTVGGAELRQEFEYDALSRLVRAVDYNDPATPNDDHETRYTYDSLDRILSETQDGYAVLSSWDACSRRVAVTYPGGRTVTIERDAAGRPVSVTDDVSAETFELEYDAASRLACVRSAGVRQRFDYRANGTESSRYFDRWTGTEYTNFAWLDVTAYDFRNLAECDQRCFLPNPTSSLAYHYDNRGGLTATTTGAGAVSATWTLDKAGNWTATNQNGANEDRTVNKDNEYATIIGGPVTGVQYDANGSLTELATTTENRQFTYDWANRLVAVSVNGATVASYTYDAFNRRITTSTADGVTRFVYDGNRVIEEYNDRTPSAPPLRAHVYGLGPVPVFSIDSAGAARYLLTDRQNSVVALTDNAGNVLELYRYTPYGHMTVCTPSGVPLDTPYSTLNPAFGFTGQRYDPEPDLWDFRNRVYSPTLGRFLQRDPAGFADGYNTYLYCRNSPPNFTDPDGRMKRSSYERAYGSDPYEVLYGSVATPTAAYPIQLGDDDYTSMELLFGKDMGRALAGVPDATAMALGAALDFYPSLYREGAQFSAKPSLGTIPVLGTSVSRAGASLGKAWDKPDFLSISQAAMDTAMAGMVWVPAADLLTTGAGELEARLTRTITRDIERSIAPRSGATRHPGRILSRRLERLGYDRANHARILRDVRAGRPVVVVGESMKRVNAVRSMVDQAGGMSRAVPKGWASWTNPTRNTIEANRSWLRYWTKGKGATAIDIGRQSTPRFYGPSMQYWMENNMLHKWGFNTPFNYGPRPSL